MPKEVRDKELSSPCILVFVENGKFRATYLSTLSPPLMLYLTLPLHSPMIVDILIIGFNIIKHTIKLAHACLNNNKQNDIPLGLLAILRPKWPRCTQLSGLNLLMLEGLGGMRMGLKFICCWWSLIGEHKLNPHQIQISLKWK